MAALMLAVAFGAVILPNTYVQAAGSASGKIELEKDEGTIGAQVPFHATGLKANQPAKLMWLTVDGSYELEGIYTVIGPKYVQKEVVLLEGMTDAQGEWRGTFTVPKGFGGDHTVYVRQDYKNAAQNVFYVHPTFHMSPTSGPLGTEITITAEGIGWTSMESNWQLTYDNKMTGLISSVSTDGSATAKIRASGHVGKHTLTIWHGYLGLPYINHQQAPNSYLPVPTFTFEVTDEPPLVENRVGPIPATGADGGVAMPELAFKSGVSVSLSQSEGTVGEKVTLQAEGLPAGKQAELVWYTMVGNRVTAAGFSEKAVPLGTARTDGEGKLSYEFAIPDDLGGVPHRLSVKIGKEVYGEAYLRILPSLVSISPTSGPAGTEITVEIKGSGWTEFDNAYYLNYDNAYTGYMCSFNSQGTLKFTIIAAGEPGYHLLDLYPGIYRGKKSPPDVYLSPQLSYEEDHPGSAMPAIHLAFEITE
jgi:hypothetical protein